MATFGTKNVHSVMFEIHSFGLTHLPQFEVQKSEILPNDMKIFFSKVL